MFVPDGYFTGASAAATRALAAQREAAEQAFPTFWYDLGAQVDGTGTEASPWRFLREDRIHPGQRHLLKRGRRTKVAAAAWLNPTISGAAAMPIILGAYGDPAAPLPVIDCAASNKGLRFGHGVKFWRVRDLDIIGPGAGANRYGISQDTMDADGDSKTTFGHVIERVTIRDLKGDGLTDCNGMKVFGADWEIRDCDVRNIATDGVWFYGLRTLFEGVKVSRVAQDGRKAGDCMQSGGKSDGSVHRQCYLDHGDKDNKQCIYYPQPKGDGRESVGVLIEDNICKAFNGLSGNSTAILCGAPNSLVRGNIASGGIQAILLGEGCEGEGNHVTATVGRGIELRKSAKARKNFIMQVGTQSGQTYSVGIRNSSSSATGSSAEDNMIIGFETPILAALDGAGVSVIASAGNMIATR